MTENYFEVLPPEIKQIIFNELNIPDLLNLCLVCTSFNEFIGQSSEIMRKIWIKFYSFKIPLLDLNSLAVSSRKYEKLKINRVNKNEHFQYLTDLGKMWRKVLIYNCEFKRIDIFHELLKSFESIEELELSDIEVLNNESQIRSINFSCLKRVMFRNVRSTLIEVFLGQHTQLENASFDIVQIVDGKMPLSSMMYSFLKLNQKLKHLQLGPHFIKSLFDCEDTINMKFDYKLEKLMLKFPIVRDDSLNIEKNVCLFLENQEKINWILFLELQNEAILCSAWNNLKSLSHITFVGLEGLFDESMDLAIIPNYNITTLELLSRKILISQLRKVFAAAPNLKNLHVHTLTKYIMEFSARNHPNIQRLTYETYEEEAFEVYDLLKESEEVNKNIQLVKENFWRDVAEPQFFTLDPMFWHS